MSHPLRAIFDDVESAREFHLFPELPLDLQVLVIRVGVDRGVVTYATVRQLSRRLYDATFAHWRHALSAKARAKWKKSWNHTGYTDLRRRPSLSRVFELTDGVIWDDRVFGLWKKVEDCQAVKLLADANRLEEVVNMGKCNVKRAIQELLKRYNAYGRGYAKEKVTLAVRLHKLAPYSMNIIAYDIPLTLGFKSPDDLTAQDLSAIREALDTFDSSMPSYLAMLDRFAPAFLRRVLSYVRAVDPPYYKQIKRAAGVHSERKRTTKKKEGKRPTKKRKL